MRSEDLSISEIKALDLFNIASIKRTGGIISEIKFFDKIKACLALKELEQTSEDDDTGFINALMLSAKRLGDSDEDEE